MSRLWAYPFFVAMLAAPSAFTAAYFFLGKSRQNRSLLHPALRCASPSLRLAFFGYAEGAAHRPLQAPPLSLLKSQSAAPELACMKIKINTLKRDFPAMRGNW